MAAVVLRKFVTQIDEIFHEGGPPVPRPGKRGVILAVIANPFAGRYVEDIAGFMEDLKPLGLDMAGRLLAVQRLGLDIDHLTAWNARVDAVSVDMVRALARRLMKPEDLTFAIAGDPTGM